LASVLLAVVASGPILLATARSADRTSVVVVGDADAPRVAAVRAELRNRVAGGGTFVPRSVPWAGGLILLVPIGWVVVGSLIVSRQPRNWAGWLFIIVGAPLPLFQLVGSLVTYGARVEGARVPALGLWAVIGEYALYPIALLPLLFLLYPDGRVPGRRWRWAVWGLAGGVGLSVLGFALRPGPLNNWVDQGILYVNPVGVDALAPVSGAMTAVGAIVALAAALSTVIALRRRFRRSSGEERQQLRWLRFVASAAGISLVFQFVFGLVAGALGLEDESDTSFDVIFITTVAILAIGIPAAYLVAIFRHGLWQLDLVIRKTVVFATLVVLIMVLALGSLLVLSDPVTSLLPDETQAVGIVGVVIGLLVWPLRRLAVRIADRVVFGGRASPYDVLTDLAGRVGGTYSTEDVLPRIAQILAQATRAERATVWLRVGNELRAEAVSGGPPPTPVVIAGDELPALAGGEQGFEIRHQGELLGALGVAMSASDPMDPAKADLIRDLASQAGLVLRNVRLIEELRASRRRIVAAQDERAKKLERDIHDGAQQQLVALSVKLRLAESTAAREGAHGTRSLLAQLQHEAMEALDDLRDLARGLYPPLLADKGLAVALEAQARKSPVPVSLDADGVRRHPQDVEAAVYFCVLEALQNVAKYSEASRAWIRLHQDDARLSLEVVDDGRGFEASAISSGTGLQGMADRLDAVGGTLRIESSPGEGTTVRGIVPIGPWDGRR
jgi:signal transduction histidine kinase